MNTGLVTTTMVILIATNCVFVSNLASAADTVSITTTNELSGGYDCQPSPQKLRFFAYGLQGDVIIDDSPINEIEGEIKFTSIGSEGNFLIGSTPFLRLEAAKICGSDAGDIDRILVKGFCNKEDSIVNVEIIFPDHEVKGAFKEQAGDILCHGNAGGTIEGNCLTGSNKDENLIGTLKNDCIDAKGGNDKIAGLAGNDKLNGGDGKDLLSGGNGNDELSGGKGVDKFNCGAGNDKITDFKSSEGDKKASDCEQF